MTIQTRNEGLRAGTRAGTATTRGKAPRAARTPIDPELAARLRAAAEDDEPRRRECAVRIPDEVRAKAVHRYHAGELAVDVATELGLSVASIRRWYKEALVSGAVKGQRVHAAGARSYSIETSRVKDS